MRENGQKHKTQHEPNRGEYTCPSQYIVALNSLREQLNPDEYLVVGKQDGKVAVRNQTNVNVNDLTQAVIFTR